MIGVFKVGEIVRFKVTNENAMILDYVPLGTPGYNQSTNCYIIRLSNYQEILVKDFEITRLDEEDVTLLGESDGKI